MATSKCCNHQCQNDSHPTNLRFQRQLGHENNSLLGTKIDAWEQESINKIQNAADTARTSLQVLLSDARQTLSDKSLAINNANGSSDTTSDLIDLTKWSKLLEKLRRDLLGDDTLENNKSSSFTQKKQFLSKLVFDGYVEKMNRSNSLIRARSRSSSSNVVTSVYTHDSFNEIIGPATLTNDDLVAISSTSGYVCSSVRGKNTYSSGTHTFHLQVESAMKNSIFLGILSSSHPLTNKMNSSSSVYGWWNCGRSVQAGVSAPKHFINTAIRMKDEMILILNCEAKQLTFHNTRIDYRDKISVNLQACPLPWTLVVSMCFSGESVRILT